MLLRWRMVVVLWCLLLAVSGEEAPPGLVSKDSDQDLIAEATYAGAQTQKREAGGLSNSYGEPLPPDAYGPPREISNIIPDLPLPAPIYGVPLPNLQDTPPGAYGPPSPVVFPDQNYEGPPPPRPKLLYGPPKVYGPLKSYGPPKFPPKLVYGPPKKLYGPPKQSLPKPTYGAPFKTPKVLSKPFGKPVYGPPKLKPTYGPPILKPIPLEAPPPAPTVTTIETSVTNFGNVGASIGNFHGGFGGNIGSEVGSHFGSDGGAHFGSDGGAHFGSVGGAHFGSDGGAHFGGDIGSNIGSNIDLGLNLPAPIYGTPLVSLPLDLKPNFPPSETYGPPGHALGPIGPNDQLVVQDLSNIGHYGPPQPDPNPRPPHPGIPAPPTPPHVLYDGWKPIPGVSHPIGHIEETIFTNIGVDDHYGPPPPPPVQDLHLDQHQINLDQHQINFDQHLSGQIGLDQHLSSHIGLDQHLSNQITFDQHLPSVNQLQSFSNSQIASGYSNVHQDALANVGSIVGGDSNHIDQSKTVFEAHYTENHSPQSELAFVQSAITIDKPSDSYGAPPLDSLSGGPYPSSLRQQGAKGLLPPSGVYGVPPGSQYGAPPKPPPGSLPIPYGSFSGGGHSIHTGGHTPKQPVKFRDSVPEGLLEHVGQTTHGKDTHGIDHLTQGPAYLPPPIRDAKDVNHQTSLGINLSIEPSSLYSLPHGGNPVNFQVPQPSNLYGSPVDSYSVPLLTVGDHTASGSSNTAITTTIDGTLLANLSNLDAAAILKHCPYHEAILKAAKYGEKIPVELANKYMTSLNSLGNHLSKSNYAIKDQSASQSIVHTVRDQKAKSIRDANVGFKSEKLQYVSDQILKTSEKIRSLSEETKNLQQKLASSHSFNNINQVEKGPSYSVQIESSQGGKKVNPAIPHEQLLSEGLLQSILQAIEQPGPNRSQVQQVQYQHTVHNDGLVLPDGYEPIDRTKKTDLVTQSSEFVNKVADCDLKTEGSVKHEVVVAPPLEKIKDVNDVNDNEVAIFFDKEKEPVTEISVATSISEKDYDFGKKI